MCVVEPNVVNDVDAGNGGAPEPAPAGAEAAGQAQDKAVIESWRRVSLSVSKALKGCRTFAVVLADGRTGKMYINCLCLLEDLNYWCYVMCGNYGQDIYWLPQIVMPRRLADRIDCIAASGLEVLLLAKIGYLELLNVLDEIMVSLDGLGKSEKLKDVGSANAALAHASSRVLLASSRLMEMTEGAFETPRDGSAVIELCEKFRDLGSMLSELVAALRGLVQESGSGHEILDEYKTFLNRKIAMIGSVCSHLAALPPLISKATVN